MKYYIGIDPDKSASAIACIGLPDGGSTFTIYGLGILNGGGHDVTTSCVLQVRDLYRVSTQIKHLLMTERPNTMTIFVEGQSMMMGREKGVRYQDIRDLAQVSGAMVGGCTLCLPDSLILCAPPDMWKGQVPKNIHQARTLGFLGWSYKQYASYSKPLGCPKMAHDLMYTMMFGMDKVATSDWKHVLDALGMAIWLMRSDNPKLSVSQSLSC